MRKVACLILLACLLLPPVAAAQNLTLEALELQRREADGRIRLMQLTDAQGYTQVADGEAFARDTTIQPGGKIRLDGSILSASEENGMFTYAVSLDENPARVFRVLYLLAADERLLLPGDRVTAYGVFEGVSPFTGSQELLDGAPILRADLVIHQLPPLAALAADPHAATRDDPAPLGVTAHAEASWWTGYAAYELTITRASRGSEALKRAKAMSKYNINPLKTQEYFMIDVTVKALSAPEGRAVIGPEDFVFVSASGLEYTQHFLINPPTSLRVMYAPGEQQATLACLISKGDTPLIVFRPDAARPLWFDPNP